MQFHVESIKKNERGVGQRARTLARLPPGTPTPPYLNRAWIDCLTLHLVASVMKQRDLRHSTLHLVSSAVHRLLCRLSGCRLALDRVPDLREELAGFQPLRCAPGVVPVPH